MCKAFVKRAWLNPPEHSATGSIVTFDGESAWMDDKGNPLHTTFVEIADCHGKVRLHQGEADTRENFAAKVCLLRDTLSEFIEHLNTTPLPQEEEG